MYGVMTLVDAPVVVSVDYRLRTHAQRRILCCLFGKTGKPIAPRAIIAAEFQSAVAHKGGFGVEKAAPGSSRSCQDQARPRPFGAQHAQAGALMPFDRLKDMFM